MNRRGETIAAGASSVETYVDGQGPAVVIVPSYGRDGGEDSDSLSDAVVDAGYRVLRPQPRGVAGSVGPITGVGFDDMACDIAAVIDAVADGPAVVLGHAFGNFVTRATAVHHPEKVTAVILAAASGKTVAPEINSAPMRAGDLSLPESERLAVPPTLSPRRWAASTTPTRPGTGAPAPRRVRDHRRPRTVAQAERMGRPAHAVWRADHLHGDLRRQPRPLPRTTRCGRHGGHRPTTRSPWPRSIGTGCKNAVNLP